MATYIYRAPRSKPFVHVETASQTYCTEYASEAAAIAAACEESKWELTVIAIAYRADGSVLREFEGEQA